MFTLDMTKEKPLPSAPQDELLRPAGGWSGNRCQSMSNFDIDKRCFKDLTKSLGTHLEYLGEHVNYLKNCFSTGSDFLVISKSIDKCNMSLWVAAVLGIGSTHHYVRWQADLPRPLPFPACSIA